MKKKLLSILLTAGLILVMMPGTVQADTGTEPISVMISTLCTILKMVSRYLNKIQSCRAGTF